MHKVILLSALLVLFTTSFAIGGTLTRPRLLIGPEDVDSVRNKAKTHPYSQIVEGMKTALAKEPSRLDDKPCYDFRPRHQAALYLATGDEKYARAAEKICLAMIEDKEFWNDPGSKGLTRAAGAATVAFAYDLCHDVWSEQTRKRIEDKLIYASRHLIKSMGRGANTQIANNWQAVRYSAAGLAALVTDHPDREKLARECYSSLIRHLKANLGTNGWNPEGIGYTIYPWTFTGPFGVAAERAGIGDLRKDCRPAARTHWTTLVGTVAIRHNRGLGMRADLSDDHPVWVGHGLAGLAFRYAPKEQLPAIKWMYDYLVGERGDKSYDSSWGGGIYSLLQYPTDQQLKAKNPGDLLGLNYLDKSHGLALFRNRYKDENDIVAVVNAHSRQPAGCHGGPDTNTIRLLGLGGVFIVGGGRTNDPAGQTNLFPKKVPARGLPDLGTLEEHRFEADGSGYAQVLGSCMGVQSHRRRVWVDYSGRCGAPALMVNTDMSANGRIWRLNTPEFNRIETDGNSFTLHSPNGATLHATVLEPAEVTFRTGKLVRGGGSRNVGVPYHGKEYKSNRYIEFDCPGRAAVVMTLQKGDAPDVEIERSLHGAAGTVGKLPIAYEKQSGTVLFGNEAESGDILTRRSPLSVRNLRAEVRSDSKVRLRWIGEKLGAHRLLVQRRPADSKQWQTVDALAPAADHYVDASLKPETSYVYRLVAASGAQRAEPSNTQSVRTWAKGMGLSVEDFATDGKTGENSLGPWKSVSTNGASFHRSGRPGSQRGAEAANGYMVTPRIRIRNSMALVNQSVRCDLSAEDAAIDFDMMDESKVAFGIMIRTADGTWWQSDAGHHTSKERWETIRVPLAGRTWSKIDPKTLRMTRTGDGGRGVSLSAEQLKDIRGIGLHFNWVINNKWLKIDQVHLRARDVKMSQ
ncbi:MAG: fibronectin type III domain-containing protein [Phycisphaerae bacterium]